MSLRLTQGDENSDAGCPRSGFSDRGNNDLIVAFCSLFFDRIPMSLQLTQGDENTDAGCPRSGISDRGNNEPILAFSSLVCGRAENAPKTSLGFSPCVRHRLRPPTQG